MIKRYLFFVVSWSIYNGGVGMFLFVANDPSGRLKAIDLTRQNLLPTNLTLVFSS